MITPKEMPRVGSSWPWWRCTMLACSALALALSAYLAWHYLRGGRVIGCGGGSPCEQVLSSRWSAVGGVLPVSGLAAGAYLALLLACFFIGPRTPEADRRMAWGAMLILVGAAAGCAVWFSIVQEWMIGALCPYCMATHITGLVLAALVLWQAPRQRAGDSASLKRAIGRAPVMGLPLAGVFLAGILAACQLAIKPPVVYRSGEAPPTVAMPILDPHAIPLVGSPDAPYIVTLLFDYKCPHCQHLHSLLEDVIKRYDGRIAFALCPAPLNNQCNPYIAREVEEFKDSCDLARMGLAVFKADPKAFPAFDTWMFSPDPGEDLWHPRSLEAARAKAVTLVGETKLSAALADPWVNEYLHTSVTIFGQSINPDQSGSAVPKLIFGSRWVTPEPQDAGDLVSVLSKSLRLPEP